MNAGFLSDPHRAGLLVPVETGTTKSAEAGMLGPHRMGLCDMRWASLVQVYRAQQHGQRQGCGDEVIME